MFKLWLKLKEPKATGMTSFLFGALITAVLAYMVYKFFKGDLFEDIIMPGTKDNVTNIASAS
jgi:hypothetical protein